MSKPAARVGDMHSCPMVTPGTPPVPHVGGPITGPGVPTVLIGNMPAAVLGDMCVCVGPPDTAVLGSTGVLVGGKPALRLGDSTAHGGVIVGGFPTVLIGEVSPGKAGGAPSVKLNITGITNESLREEYTSKVKDISKLVDEMHASNKPVKEIAKEVFKVRRQLTIKYKKATPEDLLIWIYRFNDLRYSQNQIGDKYGLTWEGALKKSANKNGVVNYEKIIESASRPLGDKQDLGVALFNQFGDDVLPVLNKYDMARNI